jgi:sulfate permease, SulP family
MQIGAYKFDRMEFAGSLGDLGTLIPLSIALIVINGLSVTPVFLMVGLFYIICGLYFKLPIPVQPLKVVSAIAIAFPDKITPSVIAASGLIFGAVLLFLAFTRLIDWIAAFFSRPIVRGIQLGLGLILIHKGLNLIFKAELFINQASSAHQILGIPVNTTIGILAGLITLLLLSSKRFPAAIVIVVAGIGVSVFYGALSSITFAVGPTAIGFSIPTSQDLLTALVLLVIPQIPLTLGNAIIGTSDTARVLFKNDKNVLTVTNRSLSISMGLVNLLTGFLSGMPMCHGSGGLAAHHRFGARTGGSNILIGLIFVFMALAFGAIGVALLMLIPNGVLGVLLLFAGLELAVLIRDVESKSDLFVTLIVAGIGFSTTNMGIAFVVGILVFYLIKWRNLEL